MPGKRMTRLGEAEALRRIENAARTTGEFQELTELYNKLDANRERRGRYHEIKQSEYNLRYTGSKRTGYRLTYIELKKDDDSEDMQEERPSEAIHESTPNKKKDSAKNTVYNEGAVIPSPLMHPYWKELLRGDFISTIYDNADEVWQIIGDWQVGCLIKELTAKQRDVLFRSAVRLCSSEQIAVCTGKTKRGVNKLLADAMERIRSPLVAQIGERFENDLFVTIEKREFFEWYTGQKRQKEQKRQEEAPDKTSGV